MSTVQPISKNAFFSPKHTSVTKNGAPSESLYVFRDVAVRNIFRSGSGNVGEVLVEHIPGCQKDTQLQGLMLSS